MITKKQVEDIERDWEKVKDKFGSHDLRFVIKKQAKEMIEKLGCEKKFFDYRYRKYVNCTCGDFKAFFCEECRKECWELKDRLELICSSYSEDKI